MIGHFGRHTEKNAKWRSVGREDSQRKLKLTMNRRNLEPLPRSDEQLDTLATITPQDVEQAMIAVTVSKRLLRLLPVRTEKPNGR